MAPLDAHDLQFSHDLGTVEGRLDLLLDRTKDLPELFKKVESHDTKLHIIQWVGTTTVGGLILLVLSWLKSHVAR